jgi:aryl-alcohol dehydrogenase (NADP+)
LEEKEALPFVQRALEGGINFFDTADVYSLGESERILGNTLRQSGVRREAVVIATKVFNPMGEGPNDHGNSRKHILESIDASLKRLGMEYVDLYQIHRWDYETPIEETLQALDDVVRSGRARYIGASSMFAWQLMKSLAYSEHKGLSRFVSMQDHYNLVYREEEREMIPLCLDQGLGLIPWSPMARGFFSGSRTAPGQGETTRARSDPFGDSLYFRESDFAVLEAAKQVAAEQDVTASQVALAWLLNKPHISSPIIGATKMEHLDQAITAVEIKLSEEQVKRLEQPYTVHPVLGHA